MSGVQEWGHEISVLYEGEGWLDEVMEWLRTQTVADSSTAIGPWHTVEEHCPNGSVKQTATRTLLVYLGSKRDAMLFKLTWGGTTLKLGLL